MSRETKIIAIIIGFVIANVVVIFTIEKESYPKLEELTYQKGMVIAHSCFQRKKYSPNKLGHIDTSFGKTFRFANPYSDYMIECVDKGAAFYEKKSAEFWFHPETGDLFQWYQDGIHIIKYSRYIESQRGGGYTLWCMFLFFAVWLWVYIRKRRIILSNKASKGIQ